jgi:glucosamine-6-phosphate deaminase
VKCQAFPSEDALAAALGRIILGLYAELVRLTALEQADWSDVRTFNLDEFVGLEAAAPGSYRAFMQERLFRHVNVRPEHIGFLDGTATDVVRECQRYERAIAAAGGIDLLVLGIGANGHIGFNEPAAELVARTHLITLDEPTRAANALWFGGELARVPRQALTMGMATILAARAIVLIATGDAKADAVRAMLYGGVTTAVPASFLQLHPQVRVMLDESLADQLA